MHVPVGHSFPDATAVAFALGLGPPSLLAAIFIRDRAPMVQRTLLNLLRLLLGPKPERRRALLFSSGFFFYFLFFIDYPGIFGGLNMVKNS